MKKYNILLLFVVLSFFQLTVPSSLLAQKNTADFSRLCINKNALNFLVISDYGRNGIEETDSKAAGQMKVAKQMGLTAKVINASFVVTCGDNFHGHGVKSAKDSLWFVNYENVYKAPSLMIPWYITLGNHDYAGNVDAELEYAKTSKRWIEPARYYSFTKTLSDSSTALFLIMDSSPLVKNHKKTSETVVANQLKWCDSVLRISSAKWKFAFFHHPAYSSSSVHGSTKEIQENFLPVFEKYKVDACFSGHDHDLQHSKPENSKIEFFGVGGGSSSRKACKADFTKASFTSLGFGVVSLTSTNFKFSFVDDKGCSLYSYEIKK